MIDRSAILVVAVVLASIIAAGLQPAACTADIGPCTHIDWAASLAR